MIYQNVIFSKDECHSIINSCNYTFTSRKNWDRDYQSTSILNTNNTSWIFNRLTQFFNKSTLLDLVNDNAEIHFHKYEVGDYFGKHNDTRDRRLFSIGVLLNDDFTGGDFILNDNFILNKKIGNSYIFDSSISHEITPIITGIRYALIWFIRDNNVKIKQNKII
jgi:predicted 2-oxoglutarate/Fe(II)-dependent dioxygenase YbiX